MRGPTEGDNGGKGGTLGEGQGQTTLKHWRETAVMGSFTEPEHDGGLGGGGVGGGGGVLGGREDWAMRETKAWHCPKQTSTTGFLFAGGGRGGRGGGAGSAMEGEKRWHNMKQTTTASRGKATHRLHKLKQSIIIPVLTAAA